MDTSVTSKIIKVNDIVFTYGTVHPLTEMDLYNPNKQETMCVFNAKVAHLCNCPSTKDCFKEEAVTPDWELYKVDKQSQMEDLADEISFIELALNN